MKILQELEPITQSKKLHEKLYAMLKKAKDFTPDTADQFKEEQQLLTKIMVAHIDFQKAPKYGHEEFGDMFGRYLEETEQLNNRAGQFLTPMQVVKMMCAMLLGDPKRDDEPQYISDPAAGCGRFMLGYAAAYHKAIGAYNFIMNNVDVDFRMYVYCTMNAILYGIPSINVWGNSLSLEYWEGFVVFQRFPGLPVEWHHLDKEAIQAFVPKFEPRGQQALAPIKPVIKPFREIFEGKELKPTTLFDMLK